MLLDSSIVIYAAKPESAELRSYHDRISRSVSVISYIEPYGYQNLTTEDRERLETIFRRTEVLPLTDVIADQAILLRQRRRMGLGDAIIAATVMSHVLALVIHNTEDFRRITGLHLLDPVQNLP